jgi:hypothetical protein
VSLDERWRRAEESCRAKGPGATFTPEGTACVTIEVTRLSFCGSGLVAARDFAFYYVYFEGGASGGGPRLQIESVSGAEL